MFEISKQRFYRTTRKFSISSTLSAKCLHSAPNSRLFILVSLARSASDKPVTRCELKTRAQRAVHDAQRNDETMRDAVESPRFNAFYERSFDFQATDTGRQSNPTGRKSLEKLVEYSGGCTGEKRNAETRPKQTARCWLSANRRRRASALTL